MIAAGTLGTCGVWNWHPHKEGFHFYWFWIELLLRSLVWNSWQYLWVTLERKLSSPFEKEIVHSAKSNFRRNAYPTSIFLLFLNIIELLKNEYLIKTGCARYKIPKITKSQVLEKINRTLARVYGKSLSLLKVAKNHGYSTCIFNFLKLTFLTVFRTKASKISTKNINAAIFHEL